MRSDGQEQVVYDVYLDWAQIEAMARKAAGNQSKKSRMGALLVVVTKQLEVA